MSKDSISQYNSTANNNTDVGGVNVDEGTAPSNINNAIRELMSHLKEMDVGTNALTSPQITSINLGHASDTTLARTSAGVMSIEGVDVTTISGTQTLTNKTLTSPKINEDVAVTATATEINVLDGVTSTTAELNKLDGVTATTAELNYTDVTTLGLSEASKAVTADANGVVSFDNGTIEEATTFTSSSNTATLNLQDGNVFEHTLTENVTLTFSNPASSGRVSSFVLKIKQDASASGFTVTFPSSVDFVGGSSPTLTSTANGIDVFVIFTTDGGTIYNLLVAGQDIK